MRLNYPLLRNLLFPIGAFLALIVFVPAVSAFQETAKPAQAEVASPQETGATLDELRTSLRKLVVQVEKLAKRVSDLEKERLFDVTRVLLVGEEQRAESLQTRLRDNLEKQFSFQLRLEQVDNQLKPENIERLFIGVGMVRPEEAREAVRRRLSVERQGITAQLELLRQERNRFQRALESSDIAIQRYRLRLAEAGRS
jgi:hypothetical protein